MKGFRNILRGGDKISIFILIAVLSIMLHHSAFAADAGITMRTNLGGYAGTQPLTPPILAQLGVSADTDNANEIRQVLNQLKEGGILALSVHSNPSVFAVGGEPVQWGRFWEFFGIERPPELAAVIIGGCMSREFKYEGNTEYVHISEPELNFIRRRLNTKVLFVPKGEIHKAVAINDTNGILRSMLTGKRLSEIDLQGRWHYVTSPDLDRGRISLPDLRGKQLPQLTTTWEEGNDRMGSDYTSYKGQAGAKSCQEDCIRNPRCKAWTYVKPKTFQDPEGRCWLKHSQPGKTPNKDCISGIVNR